MSETPTTSAQEPPSAGTGHDDMTNAEQQAWHEARKAERAATRRCPRRACRGRIPHSWLTHWFGWWRS